MTNGIKKSTEKEMEIPARNPIAWTPIPSPPPSLSENKTHLCEIWRENVARRKNGDHESRFILFTELRNFKSSSALRHEFKDVQYQTASGEGSLEYRQ